MTEKKERTRRTTIHMTETHIQYLKANNISFGKLMSAMVSYLIENDATEFNDDEYRDAYLLFEIRKEISEMNVDKINRKMNELTELIDELEDDIKYHIK